MGPSRKGVPLAEANLLADIGLCRMLRKGKGKTRKLASTQCVSSLEYAERRTGLY